MDTQGRLTQNMCPQYISPSDADDTIRKSVWIELENAPLRLLHTSTGLLYNRAAQINSFKTSQEYKDSFLSFTTKHSDRRTQLGMERTKDVVATYFDYVLLSQRWRHYCMTSRTVAYELDELGIIVKLQSFCKC
ncbi:hypothetical protein F4604DRAFT_139832 [Suillus subluteus]|nr:hypothetical protein F4604DRAFT_139832 [Suillus subluteus]